MIRFTLEIERGIVLDLDGGTDAERLTLLRSLGAWLFGNNEEDVREYRIVDAESVTDVCGAVIRMAEEAAEDRLVVELFGWLEAQGLMDDGDPQRMNCEDEP